MPSALTFERAAELLAVTPADLAEHMPEGPVDVETIVNLACNPPASLQQVRAQAAAADLAAFIDSETRTGVDLMDVALRRTSSHTLAHAHVHVGPTNSGKTHDALTALAHAGAGVYAGPLRMLAREAYDKLCALAGTQQVGLITGEEKINPGAPIIAATTEAAPTRGKLLVLDETHWVADPDRGWAWTRLLLSGRFDTMHVIADAAAQSIIVALLADATEVTVTRHERLTPLRYGGRVTLADVPPKTAVVAFSRKAVLALADYFERRGRPAAVLYGALPPAARLDQVARLVSGEVDVVCCTDVIGHGINLPIDAVALAEGTKFDGTSRRDLHVWEAAQIAGRAGRFGHSTAGTVVTPTGLGWLSGSDRLAGRAADAAAGRVSTGWALSRAQLRPTLAELGAQRGEELPLRLVRWGELMAAATSDLPVSLVDVGVIVDRVRRVMAAGDGLGAGLDVGVVWRLATCPVDEVGTVVAGANALCGTGSHLRGLVAAAKVRKGASLEAAEACARVARDLRALTGACGDLPGLTRHEAAQLEEEASNAVVVALRQSRTSYGRCAGCGKSCPPWFTHCDPCHQQQYTRYDDDYGWDGRW